MNVKNLAKTLSLVASISLLSACDYLNFSNEEKVDVELSSIKAGFIEKGEGSTDFSVYDETMTDFFIASKYYLVFEFSITSKSKNNGQHKISTITKFPQFSCFDASVQQVDSGDDPTPIPVTDSDGTPKKYITSTFAIPKEEDDVYKQRMVFGITPIHVDEKGANLTLNFSTGEDVLTSGQGKTGKTVNIAIHAIQLAAPEVSRSGTQISWGHIEHADYYKIYYGSSDSSLLDENGEDYHFLPPQGTSPGSPLYFSAWSTFGIRGSSIPVRVRAFSETPSNYLTSAPSTTIFIPAL